MIKTKDIRKSFDDIEVLKGISLTFEPGINNLIIGRSGAGKTVFLKTLVGLIHPSSGEVLYNGENYYGMDKHQIKALRMQMGMLFQGSALFDSKTVAKNISFPLDMFSTMTEKEKQKRVDECLERVDLVGVNDKLPSEISGGMQKRVGIARAIVLNPKYLFCDEPNSGLDPKTSILIDELINDITREYNITTVINTHDMNSVMGIGDNICLLKNGILAWQGNKDEVFNSTNPDLQEFIFASPFLKDMRNEIMECRASNKT